MMSEEPVVKLQFLHRFRNGTLCFYGAYLGTGEIKTWRCEPGQKTKARALR
jgi:hypothetical protein